MGDKFVYPRLHSTVLLEVNYHQVESLEERREVIPQCFLLLGNKKDEQNVLLEKVVYAPVIGTRDDILTFDEQQIIRRVELITTTFPKVIPYAILLINPHSFNYKKVYTKLVQLYPESILWIFGYNPNINKTVRLNLRCWQIISTIKNDNDIDNSIKFNMQECNYEIVDLPISIKSDNTNNCNLLTNNNIGFQSQEDINSLSNGNDNSYDDGMQNDVKNLVNEIDKIIRYLQKDGPIPDKILRKVSLLMNSVQKPATNDINEQIRLSEERLSALKMICQQWEDIR